MRNLIAVAALGMVFVFVAPLARAAEPSKETVPGKADEKPVLVGKPMLEFTCPMHPDVTATWATKCPTCGMMLVRPDAKPAQGAEVRPMTCCPVGMPEQMTMQCRMLMATQIDARDPGTLLGLKDDLKLSDEQATKLAAIAEKARADAAAVLTDAQKEKIKALGDTPKTMRDMCGRVMSKMQELTKDGKGGTMMCPMMMSPAATQPAQQPGASTPQRGQNATMWCPMRCW